MNHFDRAVLLEKYKGGLLSKVEEAIFVNEMFLTLTNIRNDSVSLSLMKNEGPCSSGMIEVGNYILNKYLQ